MADSFINHYISGSLLDGNIYVRQDYNASSSSSFSIGATLEFIVSTTSYTLTKELYFYSGESISPSVTLEFSVIPTSYTYIYTAIGNLEIQGSSTYSLQSITVPEEEVYGYAHWSAKCLIDNIDVSSQLRDEISIEYEEDASTVAQFVILPPSGPIDPLVYVGKEVQLWWEQYDTNGNKILIKRRFYGAVADIEWDVDRRSISITADTQLPAYFNDLTREEIEEQIGGLWSEKVWDNEDDATGWTYAQERLSTTENVIWHDAHWNLQVTDLKAKRINGVITPDYTFTDNERFHETLKLEYAQRSEMTNNIKINISYSYERKRERQISFSWKSHNADYISSFLCNRNPGDGSYQLCQRSMVESAASSGDWVSISPITYTPLWPAQIVSCGSMYDIIIWGVGVTTLFMPNPEEPDKYAYNESTGQRVYDRQVAYETPTSPEITNALCLGAAWKAARRWLQNVEELYEIIVKAPDSIEAIGEVTSTEEYSLEHDEENEGWENSLSGSCTEENNLAKIMPGSRDLYIDAEEYSTNGTFNRDEFNEAQEVILAAAKGDILRSHRLTTVSFQVAYQPYVTLAHTVQVITPYLIAEGKVKSTKDVWSLESGEASTEISIAISRHNGSGLYTETDNLTPVEKPTPTTEPKISRRHELGNYVGGRIYGNIGFSGKYDSCIVEEEKWDGFFTNFESPLLRGEYADWMGAIGTAFEDYESAYYQKYLEVTEYTLPYQFLVRGPEIDEGYVDATLVSDNAEYNIAVPQDTLELSA
jgi:hypothetical protein